MLPANSTFAMGTPVARLFFEPQNRMVIRSARLKRNNALDNHIVAMTMAKSRQSITRTPTRTRQGGLPPQSLDNSSAEGHVNDQQYRAAIDEAGESAPALDPPTNQRPDRMTRMQKEQESARQFPKMNRTSKLRRPLGQ